MPRSPPNSTPSSSSPSTGPGGCPERGGGVRQSGLRVPRRPRRCRLGRKSRWYPRHYARCGRRRPGRLRSQSAVRPKSESYDEANCSALGGATNAASGDVGGEGRWEGCTGAANSGTIMEGVSRTHCGRGCPGRTCMRAKLISPGRVAPGQAAQVCCGPFTDRAELGGAASVKPTVQVHCELNNHVPTVAGKCRSRAPGRGSQLVAAAGVLLSPADVIRRGRAGTDGRRVRRRRGAGRGLGAGRRARCRSRAAGCRSYRLSGED